MKGFINIFKSEGMSSAYAVGAVKKKFNMPCGHMGTLDPMASGVLPVGVSKASRLFQYLLDKEKTYIARFRFGYSTDTLDITGEKTQETNVIPSEQQIKSILNKFIGEIDQVPPKYSAKCIDGKRGYQLARQGIEFSLAPKKVSILNIELIGKISDDEYEFKIDCKGGTYIRSLARDIARECNSLAVMSKLIRTRCGVFTLENSVTIERLKEIEDIDSLLIPSDTAVSFPKAVLTNEQATRILNGLYDHLGYEDGLYRVYNQSEFWGVGQSKDGILKIKAYVR